MPTGNNLTRHPLTLSALGTAIGVMLWLLRAALVSGESNAQDSPPAANLAPAVVASTSISKDTKVDEQPPADAGSIRHEGPDIVGRWQLNEAIQRAITIEADGTAVMHVKLDVFSAFRYGPEMTLNLKWTLEETEDGWRMTYAVVDGQPELSVQRLKSDWGTERAYDVLEVAADSMLLQTKEKGSKERWVRVSETKAASTEPSAME